MVFPGVSNHLIDPRTGRPQPHGSWQAEHLAIGTGWAFAVCFLALAAYVYARSDVPLLALAVAGIAGLHFLGACLRRAALRRKERLYRAALAAYEAALAHAVDWEETA